MRGASVGRMRTSVGAHAPAMTRVHCAHAHSVRVPRARLLHFFSWRSTMASGNPPGTRTDLNSIRATRDYLQQAMVQLDRADPSKFKSLHLGDLCKRLCLTRNIIYKFIMNDFQYLWQGEFNHVVMSKLSLNGTRSPTFRPIKLHLYGELLYRK